MPNLTDITHFLDVYLQIEKYSKEEYGLFKPAAASVRRMGFVLEAWPQIYDWIKQYHLDALFIHRPWKLTLDHIPASTGVVSYHLPFDEKLTLGYNLLLAQELGMTDIQPMGEKEGRPLGMTGVISAGTLESFTVRLENLFGHAEKIHIGKWNQISTIAVMGAMTEGLILEAARKGIQFYLTGQFRKPAANAVAQTGLHVMATGHLQSELYGLRLLANILTEKWPDLQVYLAPT